MLVFGGVDFFHTPNSPNSPTPPRPAAQCRRGASCEFAHSREARWLATEWGRPFPIKLPSQGTNSWHLKMDGWILVLF